MIHQKKLAVIALLFISLLVMSFKIPTDDAKKPEPFKNLKVLPKNISHDDLIAVMKNYCTGLGVKCGFCHAKGEGDKLDFASDAKEEKGIARKMQKMANAINKKYFGGNSGTIACMTCHNGQKNPVTSLTMKPIEQKPAPQKPADSTQQKQ